MSHAQNSGNTLGAFVVYLSKREDGRGYQMTDRYEKAVALWQSRNITTDAQLAEALNGHSIAFT